MVVILDNQRKVRLPTGRLEDQVRRVILIRDQPPMIPDLEAVIQALTPDQEVQVTLQGMMRAGVALV